MKRTDLAYIAGILDGEGSISISQVKKNHKSMGHTLRISVTNTNEWICQWLHFNFGGTIRIRVKGIGWGKKDIWEWSIASQKALSFLQLISPYIKLKRPQVDLALQFQKKKRRGHKLVEERAVEEAQRILMRSYNSAKGKSRDSEKKSNGGVP